MDGGGAKLNTGINTTADPATCLAYLQSVCVANSSLTKRFVLCVAQRPGPPAPAAQR